MAGQIGESGVRSKYPVTAYVTSVAFHSYQLTEPPLYKSATSFMLVSEFVKNPTNFSNDLTYYEDAGTLPKIRRTHAQPSVSV